MKKSRLLLSLHFLLIYVTHAQPMSFDNPLPVKFGDPYILKASVNFYYMMYSANFFGGKNYAVGYATSASPLGPFKKADNNPVLQKNVEQGGIVTGTGHNSITLSPDGQQMLCVYHGRTSATGRQRVVFIDRMDVLPNGKLVVYGPTTATSR